MLLSFVTAGAIIATSVGTYAAWDQTTVTTDSKLTLDKPVKMELTAAQLETTRAMNTDPVYTGTATLKVENLPSDVTVTDHEIKYEAIVYSDLANKTVATGVTANATETAGSPLEGEHTITVTVTPDPDSTDAKALAENSTQLTVEVIASIETKSAS